MPFIYEKPVKKGVTFYHVITPIDFVFWVIWRGLLLIVACVGWVFKGVWLGMVWLYDAARFSRLRSGSKYYGDF